MKGIIFLSFVTASVSFAVTETKLFLPFRLWAKRDNEFLGKVCSCGYCFGHWVAIVLVIIYKPCICHTWFLLDYFFTSLAVAWLAAFQWLGMRALAERAKI